MSDQQEFMLALQEIAYFAPTLDSPYDRVRLSEWVRRLSQEAKDNDTTCVLVNPYAQLLRVQLRTGRLHSPFINPPHPQNMPHLAVSVSREVLRAVPSLPTPAPTAPFMCRKSRDGHAYVATQQIPGKGILCYLAVSAQDFGVE